MSSTLNATTSCWYSFLESCTRCSRNLKYTAIPRSTPIDRWAVTQGETLNKLDTCRENSSELNTWCNLPVAVVKSLLVTLMSRSSGFSIMWFSMATNEWNHIMSINVFTFSVKRSSNNKSTFSLMARLNSEKGVFTFNFINRGVASKPSEGGCDSSDSCFSICSKSWATLTSRSVSSRSK